MKSKFEELIKNARETSEQMFKALDELNEGLSEEPKHKEPIIGELAIGWDMKRECAVIGALTGIDTTQNNNYPFCVGELWLPNAILFESIEQYKEFIKS